MNMKTKVLSSLALLLASMNTHAATSDDPCEGTADRFTCLQALIDQEQQLITARIDYLNNTPGPKGETGPQGPQGIQGEQGADGYDVYSDFQDYVDKWMDELAPIAQSYQNDREYSRDRLGKNGYFAGDLRVRLGKSHLALSNLNRNPALMGAQTYNPYVATSDYSKLFYPEAVAGVAIDPLVGYAYSVDGMNFYRVTKAAHSAPKATLTTDTNDILYGTFTANICDDTVLSTVPSYCHNVADIEEVNTVSNAWETGQLVVVGGESICDQGYCGGLTFANSPRTVTAYQIKMASDNALYRLAIKEYLAILESDINDITQDMVVSAVTMSTKILDLQAQIATESDPDTKADLQTRLDAATAAQESMLNGVPLLTFFADPSNNNRELRLSILAASNPLVKFNITTVMSNLYYRYRDGTLTGLTTEEQTALYDFDDEMTAYYQNYIKRWQAKAYNLRLDYFATKNFSTLASMFSSPHTPDFTKQAQAELEGEVYDKQTPLLRTLVDVASGTGLGFSFGGVVATSWGMGALTGTLGPLDTVIFGNAALQLTPEILEVSTEVAAEAVAEVASSSSAFGGVGVGSAAAGPAAIVTSAVIIAIEGGIQAFEQGKKDDNYNNLVNASPSDYTLTGMTEQEITNLVYMALLVD